MVNGVLLPEIGMVFLVACDIDHLSKWHVHGQAQLRANELYLVLQVGHSGGGTAAVGRGRSAQTAAPLYWEEGRGTSSRFRRQNIGSS